MYRNFSKQKDHILIEKKKVISMDFMLLRFTEGDWRVYVTNVFILPNIKRLLRTRSRKDNHGNVNLFKQSDSAKHTKL